MEKLKTRKAKERSALDKKRNEIINKIAELRAKGEKAAAAGDLEAYNKIDLEISGLDNALYVLRRSSDEKAAADNTAEEIKNIWETYAKAFNRDLAAAWADYEKAREKAAESFKKYAAIYNNGLKQRAAYIESAGEDPKPEIITDNCHIVNNDIVFYSETRAITPAEAATMKEILYNIHHAAIDDSNPYYDSKPLPPRQNIYNRINERRAVINRVIAGDLPITAIDWLGDIPPENRRNIYFDMFGDNYIKVMKANGLEVDYFK